MPAYENDGGIWKPTTWSVQDAGVWKSPLGYVDDGGVWKPFLGQSLKGALDSLGLTTGLKLALDAGDAVSLPASSTQWVDTSGGGFDFNLGSTSGADANDPTIVGTPGGLSSGNYLSFDGGDYLSYETSNAAWMNALHTSTGKGGMAIWLYVPSLPFSDDLFLWGTSQHSYSGRGMVVGLSPTTGRIFCIVFRGSSPAAIEYTLGTTECIQNSWNYYGIGWDWADATQNFNIVANTTRATASHLAPTGAFNNSAATDLMNIGRTNGEPAGAPANTRMGMMAMWQGYKPTVADLTGIYDATRNRYGL